jgi:hypothetical protein
MEPLADLGPGERGADHDAAGVVQHQPGRAGRTITPVEAGARRRLGGHVHRAYVQPCGARALERVAHRRHLRVGEDHSRRARVVADRAGILAEDRGRRYPRLVLAHMGQKHPAVHVADGVEPVLRPHPVVHLDRLPGLESHGLEPEVVGPRLAADRYEELVPAHRAAGLELELHLAVARPHRRRLGADLDVHALLVESGAHLLAGERLLLGEQAVGRLDQGHPGPE